MPALVAGLLFQGAFTICSLLLIVMQIWDRMRPKTDLFVTRSEFDSVKHEIETNRLDNGKHFAEISAQLGSLIASVSANNADVWRSIGRLEGKESA